MSDALSKNLKILRKKHNLSQGDLAEYLHISRQAISSWETGRNTPDISTLYNLSQLYEIPVDQLISTNKTLNSSLNKPSLILAILFIILFVERLTQNAPSQARLWIDFLIILIALFYVSLLFTKRLRPYSKVSVITYRFEIILFSIVTAWSGTMNLFNMNFPLQFTCWICSLIAISSLFFIKRRH